MSTEYATEIKTRITHQPTLQIIALIEQFPCLRSKMGFTGYPLRKDPHDGLCFDVDKLIDWSGPWSSGERLCALFVANVWNPGYAKSNGWDFNLFDFAGTADPDNAQPVIDWLKRPIWP